MLSTVTQQLAPLASNIDKEALRPLLTAIADRMSSQATTSAGLVISAGGSTLAKTGATLFTAVAAGSPVSIAAGTNMPALAGSISAGKYNVFCFYIDSASVVTSLMGTEGATLAAVKFPQPPMGKALIGYLVVTYASAFVGGTTALDTATTVYVSPVGAFDATITI